MKNCNSCGKCCETAGNGGLSASRDEIDWWESKRANGIWKKLLRDFEAPAMDLARSEELAAFIDRRSAEGGAPAA